MPAFGHDAMLPRGDVLKAATFVYSLSNPGAKDLDPATVEAGKKIFTANCVGVPRRQCQGQSRTRRARPDRQVLDLRRRASMPSTTVGGAGHQGHMPSWEGRLSELDRKILTLYLLDKRTPAP